MFGMLLSEAQVPSTSYYTGMFIYTFIVGLFLTVLSEQKWNDVYFEKVSLKSIGLRVQLGHINSSCVLPVPGHQDFIVLHTNGLHYVAVDFCGCNERIPHHQQLLRCEWFPATVYQPQTCATFRLLELFHVITLTGKLSAHEFYKSLEHLTDNLDINIPKVDVPSNLVFRMLTPFAKTRYRALMRMIRMWRHLKFMKRAGRGNLANGLITTRSGDLAVVCPACPMPDVNIPEDWKDAPLELKSVSPCRSKMCLSIGSRFLYLLIVALDANFRLKNLMRSSVARDPGLHTGLAYFPDDEPYRKHILKYASQKDVCDHLIVI